jgi:hypothetical protein
LRVSSADRSGVRQHDVDTTTRVGSRHLRIASAGWRMTAQRTYPPGAILPSNPLWSVNQPDPAEAPTPNGHANGAVAPALPRAPQPSPRGSRRTVDESNGPRRRITLVPASTIQPRPVKWLWDGRIALGTLALLGGREGIGKSMVAYQLAAEITRGRLSGVHLGVPRAVLVCATEDSWEHTIVPRLMGADADLERVYRIDVTTSEGVDGTLTLPADLGDLEHAVDQVDAAAIVLDPLLSRLSTTLDTHKDAEVRVALEPLVAIADRSGAALIGLIHVNKGTTLDPLTMLMGSRAFSAVARAVLFVTVDPDDESGRLRYLGQPKNNLGSVDLPSLKFVIEETKVADTPEGEVRTGRIVWQGEDHRSIADVLRSSSEQPAEHTATRDAVGWLTDYLSIHEITRSEQAITDARSYGHTKRTLQRAREKIGAGLINHGFPRRTYWSKPGLDPEEVTRRLGDVQSCQFGGETHQLGVTDEGNPLQTKGGKGRASCATDRGMARPVVPVAPVAPTSTVPPRDGTTGPCA